MSDDQPPDAKEPYLEDVLADALGPFGALLPPEERRALEQALRDAATDDPTLSALHSAARPRAVLQRSAEELVDAKAGAPGKDQAVAPLRRKGSAA